MPGDVLKAPKVSVEYGAEIPLVENDSTYEVNIEIRHVFFFEKTKDGFVRFGFRFGN